MGAFLGSYNWIFFTERPSKHKHWGIWDTPYSNKNLVREIVQERGGEVLVQLKANQKTTLEEATRWLNQSAPPFYTQPQNLAMDA